MNIKNGHRVSYRTMTVLAVFVGVIGIALQFMPDWEILAFMLSVAVLGGLIGGSEEREHQQLRQSYKTVFEWLLLVVMAAYAFIVLSRWIIFLEDTTIFLNGHWPGLIISIMCLFMGMAGLRKPSSEDEPGSGFYRCARCNYVMD